MRKSEIISHAFGLLVLALLLTWLAEEANGQATDTYIGACASQQSCTLATNVSWAAGNQVWRFTAYQPSESIRVWIWNHNPTNAHTSQTVQVWITDDTAVPSLLTNADRWVQACVTDNTTTGAQLKNVSANNPTAAPGANGKATGYTIGMYAVQIAVRITGAAAQAGSPDTFDIGVVQQPSVYPGGPQPGCDTSTGGNTVSGSDAISNSLPPVAESSYLFNGTTWDRARSGAAGYASQAAVGVALNRPKEFPTYSAQTNNNAAYATPADIMEMCGNGTTTVQITRWEVGFTATAAPAANLVLVYQRRNAADTGGTPNNLAVITYDSPDATNSSTPRTFGSAPATSANLGTIKSVYITPDNILSNSDPQVLYTVTQSPGAKPWTLRGAGQCVYLNLGGATVPAGFAFTSTIEWIERNDI